MPLLEAGLLATSVEEIAEAARTMEALGFSGLVTAEAAHEPFLPLMVAAEHTQTLGLSTGIAVAFPRSPMITASTAWDLQRYSGGRFILGLGTQVKGHNERRFSVPWDKPGPRMRDLILSIRAIWDCWQTGEPLNYQGDFYSFTLMTPFFDPGPHHHPRPPIYLAGVNPYICRLAGELCDGFFVHPMHTCKYIETVVKPALADGAASSGRDSQDLKLVSSCFVACGDNEEEIENAIRAIKQQISFYASTRTYKVILDVHGWGGLSDRLNGLSRQGRWNDMVDLIPDDMVAEMAVIGKRHEIGVLLSDKYEGVLDRISLYLPFLPGTDDDWWQGLAATLAS
ncbi:MAG: TIGR03617 family F420-dependent LLM class oxidoreductase [Candidatus Binatia bacterium]